MPRSQNLVGLAGMPLIWADVADSAAQMLDVVPVYELAGPASGLIQIFESTSNILRPVLGGSEGRFRKGVVVAYPWSGERGFAGFHSGSFFSRVGASTRRGLVHSGGNKSDAGGSSIGKRFSSNNLDLIWERQSGLGRQNKDYPISIHRT